MSRERLREETFKYLIGKKTLREKLAGGKTLSEILRMNDWWLTVCAVKANDFDEYSECVEEGMTWWLGEFFETAQKYSEEEAKAEARRIMEELTG